MQSMPPQQPVAAAAPPAPLALEHLGAWRDGWADLIAGKANLASEVEQSFVNQLKTHDIPLVMVERNEYFGKFAQKTYLIVRNPTGAAAVHIGSAGNDLSLSWSLYAPTHLNGRMIGMMLGIAFAISFLTTLGVRDAGLFFFGSVFGTFRWLLPVAFFALIAGKVWKGDWWHFFIESTGEMANDDLTALSLAVHQSLQSAVEDAGMDRMALRPKLEFKGSIARHLF